MHGNESNNGTELSSGTVISEVGSAVSRPGSATPQPGSATPQPSQMRSILIGMGTYAFWGLMPAFWKLLEHVNSLEILAHRLFWSAFFLIAICLFIRRREYLVLFRDRRAVLILLGAGLLSTFNWGMFVYAINSGHILQSSMGYYINPLVSIALGLLVFKEKLSLAQKIALTLAALGVLYFTIDYGSFPWVSIALAVSFAIYGMLKKIGGYPALPALAVETTLVVPLALVYIVVAFFIPGHAFLALDASGAISFGSLTISLLLICGGILTFSPLLLFAEAINRIPLSWMGFMQYIAPTLSFLLGVLVFQEEFTHAHAVCFLLIWSGLLLIVIESMVKQRRAGHQARD